MNVKRESGRDLWRENVHQAIEIIRAHRMRSALLIVGVAIGIMTILAMVTVMTGLVSKINDDLESSSKPYLFATRLDIFVIDDGTDEELARREKFTPRDADVIRERCPALDQVCYFVTQNQATFVLYYKDRHTPPLELDGASPSFADIFTLPIEHGRHITDIEVARRERVVMIGYGPAKDLFLKENPIGKYVDIENHRYRVVGTFANREHFLGSISNNFAIIPYTAYHKDFQTRRDDPSIAANVRDGYTLETAEQQMTNVLRVQRSLGPGDDNDFHITTSTAFLEIVGRVTLAISAVLVVIASIGLLVGGIGVMNVMLISVAERTREIGIRMALGANKRDIIQQFLMESATLTGIGGVVGTVFGLLAAYGISIQIHFPFQFSLLWTIIAIFFSGLIGIVFGIYPARRAARLDPIEALSFE
ncbi:MAG: ABC transporter permease [Candidatus Krumholzibacteria bacterium]|nr:ABC transporter permease [Candidatus Krumholzibacteria bacterium]